MVNKIMAIALIVSDLQRAVEFYRDKLGLKLVRTDDGYAEFETQGTTLELMEEKTVTDLVKRGKIKAGKLPRSAYFGWVPTEDVDALYKELKQKGVEFVVEPKTMPWGQRVAYFTDPDGNLWEISQWTK